MILNLKLSELWRDMRGSQSKCRLTEPCHVASGLSVSCSFKSVSVYETHEWFVFRLEVPPQYSQTLNNLKSNSISDMVQPPVWHPRPCAQTCRCVCSHLTRITNRQSPLAFKLCGAFLTVFVRWPLLAKFSKRWYFRQDFTALLRLASNP